MYQGASLVSGDLTDGANAWTVVTACLLGTDNSYKTQWAYVINPSGLGSGYTLNINAAFCSGTLIAVATSGAATFGAKGTCASAETGTSVQPGAIGASGDLVFSGIAEALTGSSNFAIDSSYTHQTDRGASAGVVGTHAAYLDVSGSSQPTWSWTLTQYCLGSNINFTIGAGGGASQPIVSSLAMIGVM